MSLHIETPLLLSEPLSARVGVPVYLKLELLQPSGSFKDRGMGHLCAHLKAAGAKVCVSAIIQLSLHNSSMQQLDVQQCIPEIDRDHVFASMLRSAMFACIGIAMLMPVSTNASYHCLVYHLCEVQRFVSSSGGNAGHSAAHAGRSLGIPVQVSC
jgi:threonine dehydratase